MRVAQDELESEDESGSSQGAEDQPLLKGPLKTTSPLGMRNNSMEEDDDGDSDDDEDLVDDDASGNQDSVGANGSNSTLQVRERTRIDFWKRTESIDRIIQELEGDESPPADDDDDFAADGHVARGEHPSDMLSKYYKYYQHYNYLDLDFEKPVFQKSLVRGKGGTGAMAARSSVNKQSNQGKLSRMKQQQFDVQLEQREREQSDADALNYATIGDQVQQLLLQQFLVSRSQYRVEQVRQLEDHMFNSVEQFGQDDAVLVSSPTSISGAFRSLRSTSPELHHGQLEFLAELSQNQVDSTQSMLNELERANRKIHLALHGRITPELADNAATRVFTSQLPSSTSTIPRPKPDKKSIRRALRDTRTVTKQQQQTEESAQQSSDNSDGADAIVTLKFPWNMDASSQKSISKSLRRSTSLDAFAEGSDTDEPSSSNSLPNELKNPQKHAELEEDDQNSRNVEDVLNKLRGKRSTPKALTIVPLGINLDKARKQGRSKGTKVSRGNKPSAEADDQKDEDQSESKPDDNDASSSSESESGSGSGDEEEDEEEEEERPGTASRPKSTKKRRKKKKKSSKKSKSGKNKDDEGKQAKQSDSRRNSKSKQSTKSPGKQSQGESPLRPRSASVSRPQVPTTKKRTPQVAKKEIVEEDLIAQSQALSGQVDGLLLDNEIPDGPFQGDYDEESMIDDFEMYFVRNGASTGDALPKQLIRVQTAVQFLANHALAGLETVSTVNKALLQQSMVELLKATENVPIQILLMRYKPLRTLFRMLLSSSSDVSQIFACKCLHKLLESLERTKEIRKNGMEFKKICVMRLVSFDRLLVAILAASCMHVQAAPAPVMGQSSINNGNQTYSTPKCKVIKEILRIVQMFFNLELSHDDFAQGQRHVISFGPGNIRIRFDFFAWDQEILLAKCIVQFLRQDEFNLQREALKAMLLLLSTSKHVLFDTKHQLVSNNSSQDGHDEVQRNLFKTVQGVGIVEPLMLMLRSGKGGLQKDVLKLIVLLSKSDVTREDIYSKGVFHSLLIMLRSENTDVCDLVMKSLIHFVPSDNQHIDTLLLKYGLDVFIKLLFSDQSHSDKKVRHAAIHLLAHLSEYNRIHSQLLRKDILRQLFLYCIGSQLSYEEAAHFATSSLDDGADDVDEGLLEGVDPLDVNYFRTLKKLIKANENLNNSENGNGGNSNSIVKRTRPIISSSDVIDSGSFSALLLLSNLTKYKEGQTEVLRSGGLPYVIRSLAIVVRMEIAQHVHGGNVQVFKQHPRWPRIELSLVERELLPKIVTRTLANMSGYTDGNADFLAMGTVEHLLQLLASSSDRTVVWNVLCCFSNLLQDSQFHVSIMESKSIVTSTTLTHCLRKFIEDSKRDDPTRPVLAQNITAPVDAKLLSRCLRCLALLSKNINIHEYLSRVFPLRTLILPMCSDVKWSSSMDVQLELLRYVVNLAQSTHFHERLVLGGCVQLLMKFAIQPVAAFHLEFSRFMYLLSQNPACRDKLIPAVPLLFSLKESNDKTRKYAVGALKKI